MSPSDLAAQARELLAEGDPLLPQNQKLLINVIHGYDLGIASSWTSQQFIYPTSTEDSTTELPSQSDPSDAGETK